MDQEPRAGVRITRASTLPSPVSSRVGPTGLAPSHLLTPMSGIRIMNLGNNPENKTMPQQRCGQRFPASMRSDLMV